MIIHIYYTAEYATDFAYNIKLFWLNEQQDVINEEWKYDQIKL